MREPTAESRFRHACHLDGALTNLSFNNIAWGKSKGQAGRVTFLGNVWQSMGHRLIRDADPARSGQAGGDWSIRWYDAPDIPPQPSGCSNASKFF
jgi:hypothetical protein